MKKHILFLVLLSFSLGCVGVKIPKYLSQKSPYAKKLYVNFEEAVRLTEKALTDLKWSIDEKVDPAMYEQDMASLEPDQKRIMIFTKVRQTPLFLGTCYAKMNILLNASNDGTTQMEIRYLTVNSFTVRNIESYKNEAAANKIFEYIDRLIKEGQ
ncbi:MAG: hypothetical protein A2Z88_07855 [Omnitrophica WOR_2 bacterium GWA2_47_8]|nr:MAG: hypothetical protein A2Z88_07855 [Omnitrophica WOR_2 bacterium GWA2_47_8]